MATLRCRGGVTLGPITFGQRKDFRFYSEPELSEGQLTRWKLIDTPWGGVFLHRHHAPDERGPLHDHPWSFFSIVLRGGYVEDRGSHLVHLRAGRGRRLRCTDAHRIVSLDRRPTWTLMLVGPTRREWGFWLPVDGWVPHHVYGAMRAEEAARR